MKNFIYNLILGFMSMVALSLLPVLVVSIILEMVDIDELYRWLFVIAVFTIDWLLAVFMAINMIYIKGYEEFIKNFDKEEHK